MGSGGAGSRELGAGNKVESNDQQIDVRACTGEQKSPVYAVELRKYHVNLFDTGWYDI